MTIGISPLMVRARRQRAAPRRSERASVGPHLLVPRQLLRYRIREEIHC